MMSTGIPSMNLFINKRFYYKIINMKMAKSIVHNNNIFYSVLLYYSQKLLYFLFSLSDITMHYSPSYISNRL